MIVLDASAPIAILLRETGADEIGMRLLRSGDLLHAPHLIDVEIVHVLRRLDRCGQVPRAVAAGRAGPVWQCQRL